MDEAKVAFLMSLLMETALQWAVTVWNQNYMELRLVDTYVSLFKVFDHPLSGRGAKDILISLQ